MDEKVVEAVLDDWRTAPVDDRMRAALSLAEALTLTPESLTAADIAEAKQQGLSTDAMREMSAVVFLFSAMDRLANAFDFNIPDQSKVDKTAKALYNDGYTIVKRIR